MSPSSLPPVATPWRYQWRAFRTGLLPGVIFGGCLLAIALLWRHSAATPMLVAEAEATQREVGPLHAGRIASLDVALLQHVKTGEVLGRVNVVTPEMAGASLAVVRAELELLNKSLAPAVGTQRVTLDFFRLQLDWMRERVELASLRTRLQQAETDLRRSTTLHDQHLVSEENHDAARALRDRLAAQTSEQANLVGQLAPAAQHPALPAVPLAETLAAGLRVQEEKLRLAELQLSPVPLVAPLDGVVTGLHRHEGETVAAGQAVFTIVAHQPSRLVGFLRQPLPLALRRDLPVEIRTRSSAPRRAAASIVEVGHALEPVPPTILGLVNRTGSAELGLRVHLSLPAQLALHPGEQVDVLLTESNARENGR